MLCTVQGPWDDGTAVKDKCKHTQGTTHGTGTPIHPGGGKFGIALVCTHLGTKSSSAQCVAYHPG